MKIENIHNEEKIFWRNYIRGEGEFFIAENLSIGTKIIRIIDFIEKMNSFPIRFSKIM